MSRSESNRRLMELLQWSRRHVLSLTYPDVVKHSTTDRAIPFVVGVIGDFAGESTIALGPLGQRPMRSIDRDNFDSVLATMAPSVDIDIELPASSSAFSASVSTPLAARSQSDSGWGLTFRSIDDFHPDRIVANAEPLNELVRLRRGWLWILQLMDSTDETRLWNRVLDVFSQAESVGAESAVELPAALRPAIRTLLVESESTVDIEDAWPFFRSSCQAQRAWSREWLLEDRAADPLHVVRQIVSRIDAELSRNMSAVLRDEAFQRLKANWLGLRHLVFSTETGHALQIELLSLTASEMTRDLTGRCLARSDLFNTLFWQRWVEHKKPPLGVLVVASEFSHHQIAELKQWADLGMSARAPVIASASPELFGVQDFRDLPYFREFQRHFDGVELREWMEFRESDAANYLVLTLPRMVLPDDDEVESFEFIGNEAMQPSLAPSAFGLAAQITDCIVRYGVADRLANQYGENPRGDLLRQPFAAEVPLDGRREFEIARIGFAVFSSTPNGEDSIFRMMPTVHRPEVYDHDEATTSARVWSNLDYVLSESLFVRSAYCYARDLLHNERNMTAEKLSNELKDWLASYQYTGDDLDAGHPGLDASEVPGTIGDTPGLGQSPLLEWAVYVHEHDDQQFPYAAQVGLRFRHSTLTTHWIRTSQPGPLQDAMRRAEPGSLEAAVADNPRDVQLKRVFGDWLEERNDPRAARVRLECELALLTPDDPKYQEVQRQLAGLQSRGHPTVGIPFWVPAK